MNKQIELEKLDRLIKDTEIRLRTVNLNIASLTREIDALEQVQNSLIDNIHFLKKKKIVAMADEYKKARDDLAKTVVRLIALQNDRENFKKAVENANLVIAEAKENIEKLSRNGNTNVIKGCFGGKNGQD